ENTEPRRASLARRARKTRRSSEPERRQRRGESAAGPRAPARLGKALWRVDPAAGQGWRSFPVAERFEAQRRAAARRADASPLQRGVRRRATYLPRSERHHSTSSLAMALSSFRYGGKPIVFVRIPSRWFVRS